MPELPEIEHLRRTLAPHLVGAVVRTVTLHRRDILRHPHDVTTRSVGRRLLRDGRITTLARRGKQLAIITDDDRTVCIHLGMSGQLCYQSPGQRLPRTDHVHATWHLESPSGRALGRLAFRDPRRFGGLWAFDSRAELHALRWARLGPDGLDVPARDLQAALARTTRAVKAALLDQAVVAGVGNIYADEALFRARLNPTRSADAITAREATRLATAIRHILANAIEAGGSTLRDYVDANGDAGSFADRHLAYGRAGQPCRRCRETLTGIRIAQRATVFCTRCQP